MKKNAIFTQHYSSPGIAAQVPFVLQAGNSPFEAAKGDKVADIPGLEPGTVSASEPDSLAALHAMFEKTRGRR